MRQLADAGLAASSGSKLRVGRQRAGALELEHRGLAVEHADARARHQRHRAVAAIIDPQVHLLATAPPTSRSRWSISVAREPGSMPWSSRRLLTFSSDCSLLLIVVDAGGDLALGLLAQRLDVGGEPVERPRQRSAPSARASARVGVVVGAGRSAAAGQFSKLVEGAVERAGRAGLAEQPLHAVEKARLDAGEAGCPTPGACSSALQALVEGAGELALAGVGAS